jgi:dihydroxyacetone kinase-like protein
MLTELDAAIGDADHGINMDRGMTAVVAALDERRRHRPADSAQASGMTLVSTVGGASGPLYGTAFLRMAAAVGGAEDSTATDFAKALRAGLDGVVAAGQGRGRGQDDVDALAPAVDALDGALADGEPLAEALRRGGPAPPSRAGTRPFRWWPARAGPATWASAASVTRIRARPR